MSLIRDWESKDPTCLVAKKAKQSRNNKFNTDFQKYNVKEKKKKKKEEKKPDTKSQKLLRKYRYKIDNKYQKA